MKGKDMLRGAEQSILDKFIKKQPVLRRILCTLLALCILVSTCPVLAAPGETQGGDCLEVHFIDVGQGNATLIKCGEHSMLIDAGDYSQGSALQLYLNKQGVKKLDAAIWTHPDADHIGGADVITTKFPIEKTFMPSMTADTKSYEELANAIEYRNIKTTEPWPGMNFKLGDATVRFIGPCREYDTEENNNGSLVCEVTYGSRRFLFTGDMETEAEQDLCRRRINMKADVLQVGHHGSYTSTSEELLAKVQPEFAVISCGAKNDYGHPHQETLERLKEVGCTLYRTDQRGTIVALTDGERIDWAFYPVGNGGYILNTNSLIFHKPSCDNVQLMSEKNKLAVDQSREELIKAGYRACGYCKP